MSFLKQQEFINALSKLGGKIYQVGGCVRDGLLGLEQKDIDLLVTQIPYPLLTDTLKKYGFVNPVGKSFGIIKFKPRNTLQEIDISLPRIEKSTGVGHKDFQVDFSPDIPVEQDLARRDFTMNAMALEVLTEELIDPFQGRKDLEDKIIRQVFLNAFVEDPLRILRGVQFSARLGFKVEPTTLQSMKENASLIQSISKERIMDEIRKLFLAPKPSVGFNLMRQIGLLPYLFPFVPPMVGVIQPMKRNQDVYDHTMQVLDASRTATELEKPGNLDIMFAALLHDAGKPKTYRFNQTKNRVTFFGHQNVSKRIAEKWLKEFKASVVGVNTDKVLNLVSNHMFETKSFYSERAIRRFINKVGPENIYDLIDLRVADKKGGKFPNSMRGIMNLRERIRAEMEKKPPFGPKDLALNGHDIMGLGFKPGPIIGKIQVFLIDKVLDEPKLNTKEELTRLIKEEFKET